MNKFICLITFKHFLKLVVEGQMDRRTDGQKDGQTYMGTYRADIAAKKLQTILLEKKNTLKSKRH